MLIGSLDPSDHRQPIMTILFLAKLNDTLEVSIRVKVKKKHTKTTTDIIFHPKGRLVRVDCNNIFEEVVNIVLVCFFIFIEVIVATF